MTPLLEPFHQKYKVRHLYLQVKPIFCPICDCREGVHTRNPGFYASHQESLGAECHSLVLTGALNLLEGPSSKFDSGNSEGHGTQEERTHYYHTHAVGMTCVAASKLRPNFSDVALKACRGKIRIFRVHFLNIPPIFGALIPYTFGLPKDVFVWLLKLV